MLSQVLSGIVHGLDVAALFSYKALWSILFGVAVTAAVDVFVDKDKMARLLGGSDAKTIGVATAAGAASSACTFGAVTVAQSLFKKGASAQSAFAFALSATNIVFELGILIYILLGWSYLGGELLSGVVLIVIVWLIARFTLPAAAFDRARRKLQEADGDTGPEASADQLGCRYAGPRPYTWTHQGTSYRFCSQTCRAGFRRQVEGRGSVAAQLRTLGGWNRVAQRYFKTVGRIWRSVVYGFLIAGFIVALVPTSVFNAVFLPSDSFFGVLENAAVGVLAGVFSFIGSIGIVPFAAALWFGGAGFAAVLGVIVSDTITVPVLHLWKSFFGTKATAYIFGAFYTAMVLSTVGIDYLFRAAGWLPRRPPSGSVTASGWKVDYSLWLTLLFLALTAALWIIHRRAQRIGAVEVTDPVCGIGFERREAEASDATDGGRAYFCSTHCARTFRDQAAQPAFHGANRDTTGSDTVDARTRPSPAPTVPPHGDA